MVSVIIRFQEMADLERFRNFLSGESACKKGIREVCIVDEEHSAESIERYEKVGVHFLPIRVRGRIQLICHRDICYLEKDRRSILIHMDDGTQYAFYGKFDEIMPMLPKSFLWCHQSYVINLDKAEAQQRYAFFLRNGQQLPISQKRYQGVRSYFKEYAKYKQVTKKK